MLCHMKPYFSVLKNICYSCSAKWAAFYNVKCREMGVPSVELHLINGEWIEVWKEFFYADHLRRVREEKNILMNKHKVLRR